MPVTFNNSNVDRIPAPWRDQYQQVIRQAIDASRPADEQWAVTTYEPVDTTAIRFDFARWTEAPHSLTFLPESDDANHTALYRIVCQFLRTTWPGGTRPL
jgi:hypothetical protein